MEYFIDIIKTLSKKLIKIKQYKFLIIKSNWIMYKKIFEI